MSAVGFNWYDVVVILALFYGLWSGIRTGFSGEMVRVVGLVLMIWLAVIGYQPFGSWLAAQTGMVEEPANLVAFVIIAIAVFAGTTLVRVYVHKRMQKLKIGAIIENLGGGLAGIIRMAVVMIALTLVLAMTRSPMWHEQVTRNSRFGAYVTGWFPSIDTATKNPFGKKVWFLNELKRPNEPSVDEAGTSSTNRPH
jgi:uncharacterized membrane protein required for colicin V production